MKVTISPSVDVVVSVLNKRHLAASENVSELQAKYDALTTNQSNLYNPARETETRQLQQQLDLGKQFLEELEQQIAMVKSNDDGFAEVCFDL